MLSLIPRLLSGSVLPEMTSALQGAPGTGPSFSDFVCTPVRRALASARAQDQATADFIAEKVSISDLTRTVQNAQLDWNVLHKITQQTTQAFNDVVMKTNL